MASVSVSATAAAGGRLWRSGREIRDLMIEYFTERKRLPDRADGNWRLLPPRAVETPVRADAQAPATGFRRVAQELAAQAPVDTDRVARIRRAIQEGRFPLSPATIADRLLALKMDWTGNEQG